MEEKLSTGDKFGLFFVCIFFGSIFVCLQHLLLWGIDSGIPRDRDILRLTIVTTEPNITLTEVFGDSYYIDTDNLGNKLVVVENPYTAKLFGWNKKYNSEFFYGEVKTAFHYNTGYYRP